MNPMTGAPSRGWPVIDRGGGALLVPYTPTGVTGSDDGEALKIQSCMASLPATFIAFLLCVLACLSVCIRFYPLLVLC